jgi:HlyD family secretion protein
MKATALLMSTLMLVTACGPGGPLRPASNATPLVPAAAVQRGSIQQSINTSAEVRAKAQITVQPQASGQLRQVFVDVGSAVHAGDVLAQLDTDTPQLTMLQARANLAAAQAKLAAVQAGARPDDVTQAEESSRSRRSARS